MGWQDAKGIKIVTKNFGVPNSHKLATYLQRGGWDGFKRAITMTPASIVDEVKKSNLRGRGGAGFSTGMKWSFVPKEAKRVYLVVNADESEPGTCKDRELMAYDPHLLFEGMAITSYALGCKHAYIYIRGEMMREAKILQAALEEAYEGGWLGKDHLSAAGVFKLDITLHRGAGAYICGEETALLNSLEGKRGWPRLKPPFPAVKGLFQEATIVNNVETLMNVPDIISKGGDWFAKMGMGKSGGTRIVCVSGHVKKPGRLRAAHGHPVPGAHLRCVRRDERQRPAEGPDPRRQLDAAAGRQRDRRAGGVRRPDDRPAHQGRRGEARRPVRHGRRPQAEDHGRLGRNRGVRRPARTSSRCAPGS